jgi:hypothetical protein
MTRRQLKEVWNVTRIVAVALAVVVGTFLLTIEVSGRFALRGEEARIVVRRGADYPIPETVRIKEVSARRDASAGNPDPPRDPDPLPNAFR